MGLRRIARRWTKRALDRLSPQRRFRDAFAEQVRLLAGVERPVVFDVGAHHGETARRYARRFPRATIHSFEPFPESFRILSQKVAALPGVHVHPFALSNRAGTAPFHANASSATNSLLPADPRAPRAWGEAAWRSLLETRQVVPVEVTTLDAFVEAEAIDRIDLLKMDTQGSEHLVLEGAAKTIAAGRIGLVYAEVILRPTYAGQKHLDELLALYRAAGFRLHNFYDAVLSEGRLEHADAIFVREPDGP